MTAVVGPDQVLPPVGTPSAAPAAVVDEGVWPGTPQAPAAVVVIRPHHFRTNPQTEADNAFQVLGSAEGAVQVVGSAEGTVQVVGTAAPGHDATAARAHAEVGRLVAELRAAGVRVHLFDDERDDRPDSVFCNNWFTTHVGGEVVLHSMHAPNRRTEPRIDVVEELQRHYRVSQLLDLRDGPVLEGTGAMVLDHQSRTVYCTRSGRASDAAVADFCRRLGYRPHLFDTADGAGRPIYHTNVMMALASEVALVGLDLLPDPAQRRRLRRELEQRGDVVELTREQVGEFAGNALELSTPTGRVLAMSARGAASLTDAQREVIERSGRILPLTVPTLELAGGSVRCMLGGIHLTPR